MRFKTRKIASEPELYTAAINALTRRPYSVHDMQIYLERRADDHAMCAAVLERLIDHKYLDDARYARQFVRQRSEIRKQGSFRIARDLRARGISDANIETAIAERASEFNEGEIVRARLKRRLAVLRGPLDQRRTASLFNSLLRAGFSSDTIRRELQALSKLSATAASPIPDEDFS